MEIWVHRNGQYAGRFSETAIRDKIADGSLSPADLAWDEAKSAWKPISEFLASLPVTESRIADTGLRKEGLDEPGKAAVAEAAESEAKPAEARGVSPPPLPSIAAVLPATPAPAPARAAGPPPLPASGPGSSIPATTWSPSGAGSTVPAPTPPEGETIWSPYMAIFCSLFLSPAFGGFVIW